MRQVDAKSGSGAASATERVGRRGDPCGRIAALLLCVQGVLMGLSLSRNGVTLDESRHLPVGLRYWDTGEFWAYHHNPPLTRLVSALPLVLADTPRAHAEMEYEPGERRNDQVIGQDFERLHREDYLAVFVLARWMGVGFAVLGGWVVFGWSRELFGDAGGLLSTALWAFCPLVLGHGGLVTPDVGAAALMAAASWAFWRYLRSPSVGGVLASGVLLGLAEGAKFTAVVLPGVWLVLAVVRFARREHAWGARPALRVLAGHAALLTGVSLATLNTLYLWEGTGGRLGEFALRSKSLTRELAAEDEAGEAARVNRFRETWLDRVRVPFPEHYLLGFDDQLWDLEQGEFYKYLRGELRGREEEGWWYYYLYGMLVKLPVGTLVLISLSGLLAVGSWIRRWRTRAACGTGRGTWGLVTELALLLPVIAIIGSLSTKTALNGHVRYVLPALPFLFVFAGRVARGRGTVPCFGRGVDQGGESNAEKGDSPRAGGPPHPRPLSPGGGEGRRVTARIFEGAVVLLVAWNVVSVVRVHPHYVAYFNEAAGGPRGGIQHLADSNLDWGQGLVALREWMDEHARRQKIRLAWFGMMDPERVGIDYEWLDPADPQPGLQAVSATVLVGFPKVAETDHGTMEWEEDAFRAYRELEPIATPGYSIYVFDLTEEDVERIRAAQRPAG